MEVLETSDIKEMILVRLRKEEGGQFVGTTGELFEVLGIDEEYKKIYSNALYTLKKNGVVESDSEGPGSPSTSFWLAKDQEDEAKKGLEVIDALGTLVAEIDMLLEENKALAKENEELSGRFRELMAILTR